MIPRLPENLEHGVNCYINPEDIYEFVCRINNHEDIFSEDELALCILDSSIISTLKEIDYVGLLSRIIKNVQIDNNCYSIYASRIDKEMMDLCQKFMLACRNDFKIEYDEIQSMIVVKTPLGMTTILYSLLAQIHETCMSMIGVCLKFKGNGVKTFPNINGNSMLESYVQHWCYKQIIGEYIPMRGDIGVC